MMEGDHLHALAKNNLSEEDAQLDSDVDENVSLGGKEIVYIV